MDDPTKRTTAPARLPRISRLPTKAPSSQTGLPRSSPISSTFSGIASPRSDAPASRSRLPPANKPTIPAQTIGTSGLAVTLAPPATSSGSTSPTSPTNPTFSTGRFKTLRRPPPSHLQKPRRGEPTSSSSAGTIASSNDVVDTADFAAQPSCAAAAPEPDTSSALSQPASPSIEPKPERKPTLTRLSTAFATESPTTDSTTPIGWPGRVSAVIPTDDDEHSLPAVLSPTTDRSPSTLSLQNRVMESLLSLQALSPSRSRLTFFGGPGAATPSRPGSRDSRPASRDGQAFGCGSVRSRSRPASRQSVVARPASSGGHVDPGAAVVAAAPVAPVNLCRAVSGRHTRMLSTIDDDSPSQPPAVLPEARKTIRPTSLRPPSVRSPTRPTAKTATTTTTTTTTPKQTLPRPAPPSTSRLPSLRSAEPSSPMSAGPVAPANNKKIGYATVGLRRPAVAGSTQRRRVSASLFEKPASPRAANKENGLSSTESFSSSPSWDGTIASKESSITSAASSTDQATPGTNAPSAKSSAALRDHIAKLRAAAKKGVSSAVSKPKSPVSPTRPGSRTSAATSVEPAEAAMAEFSDGDAAAPWHSSDPFNQSRGAADGRKKVLKLRLEAGRTTGRLNIAALGFAELPSDIFDMYDLSCVDASAGNWAESVDLTRFIAADNELETIDSAFFPDRTIEELMEDENSNGNIFAALETLDLHGNVLISLPAGLRQLQVLTSLNLANNKLSNDVLDTIAQNTALRDLNLGKNQLQGPLPVCLSRLEHLEILNVHGNKLTALPDGITGWTRLRVLNVGENAFTSLPFESLAQLPLMELQASKNKLAGMLISGEIDAMPTLQSLDVSSNQLTLLVPPGASTTIKLPAMHHLSLSFNKFRELPDVSGWQSLATLVANDNVLASVPSGFASLKSLRHADLGNNDISVIPAEVGRMELLTTLAVTGNPLRDRRFLTLTTSQIKDVLVSRLEPAVMDDNNINNNNNNNTDDTVVLDNVDPIIADTQPDDSFHDQDSSSDLEDFATPPTSAPASPSRARPATLVSIWPVTSGGVLDRSSTGSSTLDPVTCGQVASEHAAIWQVMLHDNLFTAVPGRGLSLFTATLTSLSLAGNKLADNAYLTERLELPALRELNLSRNRLESLELLTSHLIAPALEKLDVSSNRLAALPADLAQQPLFGNLAVLLAADNLIVALSPESIRGLRIVDVARNEIQHLDPRLGLLAAGGPGEGSLERLELAGNRFKQPRASVVDEGTGAVLRWLRGRIATDEIMFIPGWRDERIGEKC